MGRRESSSSSKHTVGLSYCQAIGREIRIIHRREGQYPLARETTSRLCQTLTGPPGCVQGATAAQQATLCALGAIDPTQAGVYIGRFDGGKIGSFSDGTLFPCCSTNRFRGAL